MKKQLLGVVLAVIGGACFGSGAAAQTPCERGRELSAQGRVARRDIQERIDESVKADIAGDAEAGARGLAEDFTREGWKVRRIEEPRRGPTLLDGRPYNP